VTSSSGIVCVTYHERRRCGLAGIGLVAAGRAVAAARVGDAAIGVQREGSEAGGQEAEAEEGGERQCEKAFCKARMGFPPCASARGRKEACGLAGE